MGEPALFRRSPERTRGGLTEGKESNGACPEGLTEGKESNGACPEGLSEGKESNGLLFLLFWSEDNVPCGIKQILKMFRYCDFDPDNPTLRESRRVGQPHFWIWPKRGPAGQVVDRPRTSLGSSRRIRDTRGRQAEQLRWRAEFVGGAAIPVREFNSRRRTLTPALSHNVQSPDQS